MIKTARTLLIIFFALGLFVSLTKSIIDYHVKQDFYEKHRENLEVVQKENSELKSKIQVSKDSYALEKILRNQLNYAKYGEYVVLLDPTEPAQKTIAKTRPTPPRAWLLYFFSF